MSSCNTQNMYWIVRCSLLLVISSAKLTCRCRRPGEVVWRTS